MYIHTYIYIYIKESEWNIFRFRVWWPGGNMFSLFFKFKLPAHRWVLKESRVLLAMESVARLCFTHCGFQLLGFLNAVSPKFVQSFHGHHGLDTRCDFDFQASHFVAPTGCSHTPLSWLYSTIFHGSILIVACMLLLGWSYTMCLFERQVTSSTAQGSGGSFKDRKL